MNLESVTAQMALNEINMASDLREDSLRISVDTKAKVDLCNSSRGGISRCRKAVKADDHDMGLKDKLAPFGILNRMTGLFTIIFGVSFETRDFIVDCLEQWWHDNKSQHGHINQLVTAEQFSISLHLKSIKYN